MLADAHVFDIEAPVSVMSPTTFSGRLFQTPVAEWIKLLSRVWVLTSGMVRAWSGIDKLDQVTRRLTYGGGGMAYRSYGQTLSIVYNSVYLIKCGDCSNLKSVIQGEDEQLLAGSNFINADDFDSLLLDVVKLTKSSRGGIHPARRSIFHYTADLRPCRQWLCSHDSAC